MFRKLWRLWSFLLSIKERIEWPTIRVWFITSIERNKVFQNWTQVLKFYSWLQKEQIMFGVNTGYGLCQKDSFSRTQSVRRSKLLFWRVRSAYLGLWVFEFYDRLGFEKPSQDEIKKAYRKLSKNITQNINKDPGAEDRSTKVKRLMRLWAMNQKRAAMTNMVLLVPMVALAVSGGFDRWLWRIWRYLLKLLWWWRCIT